MRYATKGYVIIGRDDCPWCDKAVDLFDEKGLEYYHVLLEYNKWVGTLMYQAGYHTVPLIFGPDNRVIGGYTELEALLKDKESKT